MQTKLHFARFEFKYLLPNPLRDELERELRYFLEFDPFVDSLPDNQYPVRSLYFDDPAYSCYYDKVDGVHTRKKFRIRTYTTVPEDPTPRFLEIKGRYNNLVLKHRAVIGFGETIQSSNEDLLVQKTTSGTSGTEVGERFQYEIFRKRLRPLALVDYQRRPYFSRFDPEFRLTFDSSLMATRTRQLFPLPHEPTRALLSGSSVMEVKFRRTIPSWFHRLIQAYELRRRSISKICIAMDTLGLTKSPE